MKRSIVVLMMIVVFCQVAFSSKKVAVLFCGSKAPVSDVPLLDTSYWLDTFLMWEMLRLSGFEDKNIYVLYGDGQDYTGEGIFKPRYSPSHIEDFLTTKITDFPASLYSLENDLMLNLNRVLTEDDLLFVWTYGRCQTTAEGFGLITRNDIITPTKFAELFTALKAYKKIYVMAQNYGERFKDQLTKDDADNPYDNVVFISATEHDQTRSIADDRPEDSKSLPEGAPDVKGIENDTWYGIPHYHSEFNFHFYSSMVGQNLYGNDYYYEDLEIGGVSYGSVYYSSVDGFDAANMVNQWTKDGLKTIDEVRQWEQYYESSETETQASCDYLSIAKHTSLQHPHIISTNLCDDFTVGNGFISDNSYIIKDEHRGEILITTDLDLFLNTKPFILSPNSHATLIERVKLTTELGGIIFDGCAVDGATLNDIEILDDITIKNSTINRINLKVHPFGTAFLSSVNKFSNSYLRVSENGKIVLNSGTKFEPDNGIILELSQNSEIEVLDNSAFSVTGEEFSFLPGTGILLKEESSISGNIIFESGSKFEVGSDSYVSISDNSKLVMNGTIMRIGRNSELVIGDGAEVEMYGPMTIIMLEGSKITVNGSLMAYGEITYKNDVSEPELEKFGERWNGIFLNPGSRLSFEDISIRNCVNAINGTPESCSVINSVIEDCTYGINLTNCSDFVIIGNKLTGNGEGAGMTMAQCSDTIEKNEVKNFIHGIDIISCPSITLIKNIITDNREYGLYITGYNAIPLLVNAAGKIDELNNEIFNNGINRQYYEGGQIFMKYSAGIAMNNGYNNVYSPLNENMPVVPCIRGESHLVTSKVDLPNKISIMAEYNYWGYSAINTFNYKNFFDLWRIEEIDGYNFDFRPYATSAYSAEERHITYSETEQNEPVSQILNTAIKLEQIGNLKPSIKLYEQIIKKYEDSPEYYVAMSRLPYIYSELENETDTLIKTYDDALNSTSVSNKKFLKEMKITTNLKSERYDEAILIAEELKSTAQTLDEILLAELDISIANMMKNAQGKKRKQTDDNAIINDIIAKLGGEDRFEPTTSPSDIAVNALPEKHELFQNYPNPFNPTTQIKFTLAKIADVRLSVYNISGQKVAELASGTKQAGVHSVEFDGSKLNSGVYYYALDIDGMSITKKLVLTK